METQRVAPAQACESSPIRAGLCFSVGVLKETATKTERSDRGCLNSRNLNLNLTPKINALGLKVNII